MKRTLSILAICYLLSAIGDRAFGATDALVSELTSTTTIRANDTALVNTNLSGTEYTRTIAWTNILESLMTFDNWPVTATDLSNLQAATNALDSTVSGHTTDISNLQGATNGLAADILSASNKVAVAAGTGGITVTPSGAGGIMTFTIDDDDAGGTPAGADTTLQFNDGGAAFGSVSNFTYTKASGLGTWSGNIGLGLFRFDGPVESTVVLSNLGDMYLMGETASRALVLDAGKKAVASSVTATELGYLSGVTSSIPNQFLGTSNRVVVAAGTGGITVTPSGAGGVMTFTIDDDDAGGGGPGTLPMNSTQFDTNNPVSMKANASLTNIDHYATFTNNGDFVQIGDFLLPSLTASRVLVTDGSSGIGVSGATATEAGHLSGVTGPIQTQFAGKMNGQTNATQFAPSTVLTLKVGPAITNVNQFGAGTNTGNFRVGGDIFADGGITGDGSTVVSGVLSYQGTAVSVTGNIGANGNLTAGDGAGDSHTLNGTVSIPNVLALNGAIVRQEVVPLAGLIDGNENYYRTNVAGNVTIAATNLLVGQSVVVEINNTGQNTVTVNSVNNWPMSIDGTAQSCPTNQISYLTIFRTTSGTNAWFTGPSLDIRAGSNVTLVTNTQNQITISSAGGGGTTFAPVGGSISDIALTSTAKYYPPIGPVRTTSMTSVTLANQILSRRDCTLTNLSYYICDSTGGAIPGSTNRIGMFAVTNGVNSAFVGAFVSDGVSKTANSGTSSVFVPADTQVAFGVTNIVALVGSGNIINYSFEILY